MFFQTIYPMLAAGTDLSINIRRVNDRLSVAVMPRHAGVKDEAQQNLVPLILSGTAVELDAEFLQAIAAPVSRTTGLLTNLETFLLVLKGSVLLVLFSSSRSEERRVGKECRL